MGDLNARVGNDPILNVIGCFGDGMCNENILRDFNTFNQLKITNTFGKKISISLLGQEDIID